MSAKEHQIRACAVAKEQKGENTLIKEDHKAKQKSVKEMVERLEANCIAKGYSAVIFGGQDTPKYVGDEKVIENNKDKMNDAIRRLSKTRPWAIVVGKPDPKYIVNDKEEAEKIRLRLGIGGTTNLTTSELIKLAGSIHTNSEVLTQKTIDKKEKIIEAIGSRVGNTPMVEYKGEVPGGNRIFIKEECSSPLAGNHYDRVYWELFNHYKNTGELKDGQTILETSSGSAGSACALMAHILGHPSIIGAPAGGEQARENEILNKGAILALTDPEKYVNAFPSFIKRFQLIKDKSNKKLNGDVIFLDHSMGENGKENPVTINALSKIGNEIYNDVYANYIISAVGNGSNTLAIGRSKKVDTKLIIFESFQSSLMTDRLHPGQYEKKFGINAGDIPTRHSMPGTSYQCKGNTIDFPHNRLLIEEGHIDKCFLVSEKKTDKAYEKLTGKRLPDDIVRWDKPLDGAEKYGRSTRAGIMIALEEAKRKQLQDFVVIGYDTSDKYDN